MQDRKNILLIFIYSLIFLILRLLASLHGFTNDEARQFFDSQDYHLGYIDQPPLFSWILKTFSFVFPLSVPMMATVTHLLIFIFLFVCYLICRKLWNERQSLIVLASMVLIFLYSYDFYRYMIHTILMTMMAAIALFIFIHLLEKPTTPLYLALGLVLALGMLSKYNFAFFIAVLIASTLTFRRGREILFSYKTIYSLLVFVLVLLPHCIWLKDHNFSTVLYALDRSKAGSETINYLEVLWLCLWNHLLIVPLLFVLPLKINSLRGFFDKQNPAILTLRLMLVYGTLIPVLVIVLLQAGNFTNRWLSAIYFALIIGVFTLVDFEKLEQRKILKRSYWIFLISTIVIIYLIKGLSYFYPDQTGVIFLHKPYRELYSDFEYKLKQNRMIEKSITELVIYSYHENNAIAAIKFFYPQARTRLFTNQANLDKSQAKRIIVWDASKLKIKLIKEDFEKRNFKLGNIKIIESYYVHSKKEPKYRIGIAEF